MMRIHLIGDSLVQVVQSSHSIFYGTWGEEIRYFFNDETEIFNHAVGGRSSRSFINEGRFYDKGICMKTDVPVSVSPALPNIKKGDYVLIQFMCNDDDSQKGAYRRNKYVFLGEPNEDGIYPTVVPTESMISKTDGWDIDYKADLVKFGYTEEEIPTIMETADGLMKLCGGEYFSYDCGATYKGYLKFYIDSVREKGAVPILVISGAKHIYTDGRIMPVQGYHGGRNKIHSFPYVEAVWQISAEEDVPVVDLFLPEMELYNELGEEKSAYLHNLIIKTDDVQNIDTARLETSKRLRNNWLNEYNERWKKEDFVSLDQTHKNPFSAYFQAAIIADSLYNMGILKDYINVVPNKAAEIPERISGEKDLFLSKLKTIRF